MRSETESLATCAAFAVTAFTWYMHARARELNGIIRINIAITELFDK